MSALEEGVSAVTRALLGDPLPALVGLFDDDADGGVNPAVAETIWSVLRQLAAVDWHCCQRVVETWQAARALQGLDENYESYEVLCRVQVSSGHASRVVRRGHK